MELSSKPFDMSDFLVKDAINLSTPARSRHEPRQSSSSCFSSRLRLSGDSLCAVLTIGTCCRGSAFFRIFYGLLTFCRANPLGAAGGDGRCAGVNSAGRATAMSMLPFGQSVRIGTGGRRNVTGGMRRPPARAGRATASTRPVSYRTRRHERGWSKAGSADRIPMPAGRSVFCTVARRLVR